MNRISYYLVLTVGIMTCLQFFPHAFVGMPAVLEHIEKGEIQPAAARGMTMIWLYSSIMMLLSGIWMLFLAKPILRGNHLARLQGLYLSIGLLAFGFGCSYIVQEVFNHMFLFTLEGILLLLAVTVFYQKDNIQ